MPKHLTVLICLVQLFTLPKAALAAPTLKPPVTTPDGKLRYDYDITDLPTIVKKIESTCADNYNVNADLRVATITRISESQSSGYDKLEKLLRIYSQPLNNYPSNETLRLSNQSYRLIMAATLESLRVKHLSTNGNNDILRAMLSLAQLMTYRTMPCRLNGPMHSPYTVATCSGDSIRAAHIYRKVLELSALQDQDSTFDHCAISSLAAILEPNELDSIGNQLTTKFGVNKRMVEPYRIIAQELERKEHWRLALKWYTRTLAITESKSDRKSYLADLNSIAKCLYAEKRYSESFKSYKTFLQEIDTAFGADSLQAIQYRKALAMLLHKHQLDSQAEQLFLKATKSCKGEANCYAHVELGKFYAMVGRLDDAQRVFSQQLVSFKRNGLLHSADGARFVVHFAKLLDRKNQKQKAEQLLWQNSLSILFHEKNQIQSEAIDVYAGNLISRGLYDRAYHLESQSLDKRIKLYGEGDSVTRAARNKTAVILLKLNRFDEADRLYKKAIEVNDRTEKDTVQHAELIRDRVYFLGLASRPIAHVLETETNKSHCNSNTYASELVSVYIKDGSDQKIINLAERSNLDTERVYMYDSGIYIPYLEALRKTGQSEKATRVADLGIEDNVYYLARFGTLRDNMLAKTLIEEVRVCEKGEKRKLRSLLNSLVLLGNIQYLFLGPEEINYLKGVLKAENRSADAKIFDPPNQTFAFVSHQPVPSELNFEHTACDTFFSTSGLPGFID